MNVLVSRDVKVMLLEMEGVTPTSNQTVLMDLEYPNDQEDGLALKWALMDFEAEVK